jgi:inosine-uridine nucleoside N-ribohydrolase
MSEELRPIPLVLDTDIGDDIDDALALAIVLNSPEIELRGVTTVFRAAPRATGKASTRFVRPRRSRRVGRFRAAAATV